MDLSTPQGRVQGGQILASHVSSESPQGLLTVQETSATAQTAILASLDSHMSAELTTVCDAPITLQELSQALGKLPRGIIIAAAKQPGSDDLPYEIYQAFWPLLGPPLLAVLKTPLDLRKGFYLPLNSSAPSSCCTRAPAHALTRPRIVPSPFSTPTPSYLVKPWQTGGVHLSPRSWIPPRLPSSRTAG